ncbi:AAA family ATPase [Sphingomonas sp. LH128]|uniref:AAA family ATPase n=1 Tax=Sphingomonas sp. LH128 TaxID=473781 RepID=UPI0002F54361
MLIKKITIENVRSFLDRREMVFDGPISIIIGPNGGGKTNLLDVVNTMLRRYLFATRYFTQTHDAEQQIQWELRYNDQLNHMRLEKHSSGRSLRQFVAIEIEVSQNDLDNMRLIQNDAEELRGASKRRLVHNPWDGVAQWKIDDIPVGQRLEYVWEDGNFQAPLMHQASHFLHYLQVFEIDNDVRAEIGKDALKLSMIYLPVNRSASGFQGSIGLAGYNDYEQKRSLDAISSRNAGNIISLAIGRLARKYRLLQEDDNTSAKEKFRSDDNLKELSKALKEIGYDWDLICTDAMSNTYDIALKKQGTSFLVSAASSGEKELLTYLFAIYALNVRDALIIVDEPELHLHPRWQSTLFALFERLAKSTGNQFVLATHSPTFISPASIQYVSRVYIENQRSNILRLNSAVLPNAKHLFNVVNSQNNERIFFTDKVVLVEGLSDQIFFEKILNIVARNAGIIRDSSLEIVSVGGKGLFPAYKQLLDACHVRAAIIADLDYVEQIGTGEVKGLFRLNAAEIRDDVLNNVNPPYSPKVS